MGEAAELKRKPRRHWVVRQLRRINFTRMATTAFRYGAMPATLYYIMNYTDPEPDLFSLLNPIF